MYPSYFMSDSRSYSRSFFSHSDDFLCARARQNELLQNGSLASPAVVGDTYCCDSRVAPVDGYVNFDDFSRGAFVVLQIMTVDGWNEVAWPTAVAVGGATAIPYYCMVVSNIFNALLTIFKIRTRCRVLTRFKFEVNVVAMASMSQTQFQKEYKKFEVRCRGWGMVVSGVLTVIHG